MNTDSIDKYRKLHDKIDCLREVYSLEDSEPLVDLYRMLIDQAEEQLDKLVSTMTPEEVIYCVGEP
jgi:hypothetical protein